MSLLLCAVFFVSGAAGLIFEALWFRQTGLTFGNSVTASSLVLASFMSGLALGSALVARWGSRIARPLRAYAALEVAIALGGVAIVWGLPSLGGSLASLEQRLVDAPTLLQVLRPTLAFLLLLVPATAMGATLPLLVGVLRSSNTSLGTALGRLYAWNTLAPWSAR
jgi:predicted membrane-bound spermidine synthase